MKKILILLVCLLLAYGLKAQTDYREGYLITLSGDTVYGKIDYRSDHVMGQVCRFEPKEGEKAEYTPYDIQAYRFTDSKYYVSQELEDGRKYFLEYLVKGKLNIYYLRDDKGDCYYVKKSDEPIRKIPFTKDIRTIDGKEYFYSSNIHIGLLNYETSEAPQLKEKINNIKEPNHKNLIELARDYHNAVCSDEEQCTIFERSVPLFKFQAELVTGYYTFLRQKENLDKFGFYPAFPVIGANLYLWLPRDNENWYVKTGALYANFNDMDIFKMLLQGVYVYPRGKIRATFSGGINYYFVNDSEGFIGMTVVPAYSAGLLALVDKNITISLNCEIETEPIIFNKGDEMPMNTMIFPSYHLMGFTVSLGCRYTF